VPLEALRGEIRRRRDASKRRGARPGRKRGPYEFMRRVLATERGAVL
jgi:hypothetical protein